MAMSGLLWFAYVWNLQIPQQDVARLDFVTARIRFKASKAQHVEAKDSQISAISKARGCSHALEKSDYLEPF